MSSYICGQKIVLQYLYFLFYSFLVWNIYQIFFHFSRCNIDIFLEFVTMLQEKTQFYSQIIAQCTGITKEMLDSVITTMEDVHNNLRKLIAPHTILIGHSFDCDLRALHLIHLKVIDTAALFPHLKGCPFKQALKKLAFDYLGKVVQADSGSTGHDSVQGKVATDISHGA